MANANLQLITEHEHAFGLLPSRHDGVPSTKLAILEGLVGQKLLEESQRCLRLSSKV